MTGPEAPDAPGPGADLVVRGRRVSTRDGLLPASVAIGGGRIVAVAAYDAPTGGARVVELAADEVLLPGLVDSHVHVNEPGRTHWEGFTSATRAAAAGGVTTIIDMPLNSIPPTVDVAALAVKQRSARGQCHVDVGFWGGAVPGNGGELAALHDAGVFGFKCFLVDSGVEEFPALGAGELGPHLARAAGLGALTIVHAEDAGVIGAAPAAAGPRYRDFLLSRPPAAEETAVAGLIEQVRRTGARAHVLHLSSAGALPALAAARAEGLPLTVETCPHYLVFAAEQIPDGATQFKCCPPIRDRDNAERLWQGLAEGVIDAVVSDHSPSTADLKRFESGDFGQAWGGVSSLQLGLSAVWTQARERGLGLEQVVQWMSAAPARIAGVAGKGSIAVGLDGDLVAFAPDEVHRVDPDRLHHKNAVTPYSGRELTGVVRATWLRGQPVDPARPRGRLLTRGVA